MNVRAHTHMDTGRILSSLCSSFKVQNTCLRVWMIRRLLIL